jgi:hypothetical protein
MANKFRFYSFVAGLYLSPLQCGLQTAHAVSEMVNALSSAPEVGRELRVFDEWAQKDKTIIILNALNNEGVYTVYHMLKPFAIEMGLPLTIFHEDEQSMNNMATATGIIVPEKFYNVKYTPRRFFILGEQYTYVNPDDPTDIQEYLQDSPEFKFIKILKGYKLV